MVVETKTKTTPEVLTLADDPEVRAARHAVGTARDKVDSLKAALAATTSSRQQLQRLQLHAQIEEAEAVLAAAQRAVEPLVTAARARIVASRRPGREELLRALLAVAEHARAASVSLMQYDEGTAAACGVVPPPFPAPLLLAPRLAEVADQLRREIDGPKKKTPAPGPRPGFARVRVLVARVRDGLLQHATGDVFDCDEKDARRLVREGAVVEVART